MHPHILGIGTANPPIRLTQEQTFYAAGYKGERIRKIFLNTDIQYRHFYFGRVPNLEETSDQTRAHDFSETAQRVLGAMQHSVEASDVVKNSGILRIQR